MKKNNILTVLRIAAALAVWFLVYKLYGAFIDPMLEGKLSETIRMIISHMLVPYTVGLGAFYLIVMGMPVPEKTKSSVSVGNNDIHDTKKILSTGFMLKAFLVQMGISMPVMMIFNIIFKILGLPVPGMTEDELFGVHMIFYIVLLLIFNPVMEEVLFRKLVLDRLLILGEVPAIIISSIMFGLPHLYSQGLPHMFSTFAIGLVWAYVRVKTGKLWPCMGLHMMFNLYGCYFALFMAQRPVTVFLIFLLNMMVLPAAAALFLVFEFKQPKYQRKIVSNVAYK